MEDLKQPIILITDFNIEKDNKIYNLELIKYKKGNYVTIKLFKKNSIYNYIFIKNITIEYFKELSTFFQNIYTLDSVIEIFSDTIHSKSIILKEIYYNSLILILKYKKIEFKLILEKQFINIDEIKFNNNPNIIFKGIITKNNNSCGVSDIFEIFIDFNNNKILASPNKENHKIDLYNLDNKNTLIKSLKGHNNSITFIKSFTDSIKNKKYLMSIDNIKLVIIWDIKNNYIKKKLTLDYKGIIYSAYLLFNLYDKDYIITSSYNRLESSKLFSFDKCKFVHNVYTTENNYTRYIIPWERQSSDTHYLVEFCDGKISIVNLFEDETYLELKTKDKNEKYCNGFLIYRNGVEYLCSSGWTGKIYILNLEEKICENIVETNVFNGIGYIIPWSENIVIGTDIINRGLIVVDLKNLKVVSYYYHIHDSGIVCIKKLNHSIYGESLLICSNDGIIKLWITLSI